MQISTIEGDSIEHLLRAIRKSWDATLLPAHTDRLYRGQRDSSWHLTPSLFRTTSEFDDHQIDLATFEVFEQASVNEFFHRSGPYNLRPSRNAILDLAIAQHYGVPTQLLDWTADPFVALMFALANPKGPEDAAVFAISPSMSYTADFTKAEIKFPIRVQHDLISFRPPHLDQRVAAQKSVFTLSKCSDPSEMFIPLDKRDVTMEFNPRLSKIVIPARMKIGLFIELQGTGVNKSALFPGLDGVGGYIADVMKNTPHRIFGGI